MERVESQRVQKSQCDAARDRVVGVALVIIGVLALLSRLNVVLVGIDVSHLVKLLRWWPIGFVITGVFLLLADISRRSHFSRSYQGRKNYEL